MKHKFIYWLPRTLSILFILFLALFSLDIFDMCNDFLNCALGLLIHNIPVIILLICLIISWKHEWLGGIAFILGGILYIFAVLNGFFDGNFEWYKLAWILQISGPAFVIAYLWLLNWRRRKKEEK